MLDTGLWILDFKGIFLSPAFGGDLRPASPMNRDFRFAPTSIKHPATSISMLQAVKLINADKLVGLKRRLARNDPVNDAKRVFKIYGDGSFSAFLLPPGIWLLAG